MSKQLDPAEAAALAQGEEPTIDAPAARVDDPTGDAGGGSTVLEALMSTDPEEPLSAIGNPWDPERGGSSRIYRGIQKMTGVDGMPAIVDVVVGIAEVFVAKADETEEIEATPETAPEPTDEETDDLEAKDVLSD